MSKNLIKKVSGKAGLPPGTLVHVGEKKVEELVVSVIDYDLHKIDERELTRVEEAFPFKESPTVTWLNITGLHEVEKLQTIGNHFGIHPLVMEDIINVEQRPKLEVFEEYVFIVCKMISYDKNKKDVDVEHMSLILGKNFVITFQEREGDIFNPLRVRIKNEKSRLRKNGSDYLAYALMDIIIDNYFFVLEWLGETIEELDEQVLDKPDQSFIQEIQRLKRDMLFIKKAVWPLREVLSDLMHEEIELITGFTEPYLRDLYDHTIQVIDTMETHRDMVSGLLDIYLTGVSNRMNEVMKVLTIIATIFIPLTFIAGIYGMNFKFMPELEWHWGYFTVLSIMIIIFFIMLVYFRRKKWI